MSFNWNDIFPGRSASASATYPFGSPRDRTPGLEDGTPYTSTFASDITGYFQRMLSLAGITPSNTPDTATVSQIHQAQRLCAGYPGFVIMHHMTTIPTGMRLLNLEGQGIEITPTYAELVAACYVGDANNSSAEAYFRADDSAGSSRNTSGAYFILADMRGKFARGNDPLASIDPDGASRLLGSSQSDALQRHNHEVRDIAASLPGFNVNDFGSSTGDRKVASNTGYTALTVEASAIQVGEDINRSPLVGVGRVSSETRPANCSVRYAIWY